MPPAWPSNFSVKGELATEIDTIFDFTLNVTTYSETFLRTSKGQTVGYRQLCLNSGSTMEVASFKLSSPVTCLASTTSFEACAIPKNYLETLLARWKLDYKSLVYNGTRGSSDVWMGRSLGTDRNFSFSYLADRQSGFPVALELRDVNTVIYSLKFRRMVAASDNHGLNLTCQNASLPLISSTSSPSTASPSSPSTASPSTASPLTSSPSPTSPTSTRSPSALSPSIPSPLPSPLPSSYWASSSPSMPSPLSPLPAPSSLPTSTPPIISSSYHDTSSCKLGFFVILAGAAGLLG
eukprot:CAMPEP_0175134500 /NCGR_PEP_ID=MMETSP0087-20121206/8213_1 /TAXON_ID=136419 /ORGANISM="Unknown Unknown, Strain D1" /LENGTH=293 /DNA_ID=CAMNT_0016417069 /DNA_START=403 /DNA_END=1284 /DNA_ORIENTATION=-